MQAREAILLAAAIIFAALVAAWIFDLIPMHFVVLRHGWPK
jgi:hypothetical protein